MIPNETYLRKEPRIIVETALQHLHDVYVILRQMEETGEYIPDKADSLLLARIEEASYAAQRLMLSMVHKIPYPNSITRLQARYTMHRILMITGLISTFFLGLLAHFWHSCLL